MDQKCFITSDNNRYLLIIDLADIGGDSYTARLPVRSQILEEVLNKSIVRSTLDNGILIKTDGDIGPWDLFKDFPPDNYWEYGYISSDITCSFFVTKVSDNIKKEFKYWDILIEEDKILFEKLIKIEK